MTEPFEARKGSSAAVGIPSAPRPLAIQLPTNPSVSWYRSFVPEADSARKQKSVLLDYLVSAGEQLVGDANPEQLRRPSVKDQLKPFRLFHW